MFLLYDYDPILISGCYKTHEHFMKMEILCISEYFFVFIALNILVEANEDCINFTFHSSVDFSLKEIKCNLLRLYP